MISATHCTTCTPRPGRPAGTKRQALSQWVVAHTHFTMGQVARAMGWSIGDADNVLQRALRRKELQVVDKIPQPGCKRKVALYARADLLGAQTLGTALASWAR
jgi:hypothetical protein